MWDVVQSTTEEIVKQLGHMQIWIICIDDIKWSNGSAIWRIISDSDKDYDLERLLELKRIIRINIFIARCLGHFINYAIFWVYN